LTRAQTAARIAGLRLIPRGFRASSGQESERDERFLRDALRQARRAERRGEIPIGAVVVVSGEVIGRGYNRPIAARDPTAHAEIVALRRAARRMGNYRLDDAELFVTLEPCLMCFGAMIQARLARVVFGAPDPKVGCLSGPGQERPDVEACFRGLNHRFAVRSGVLAEEASALLEAFFRGRRKQQS